MKVKISTDSFKQNIGTLAKIITPQIGEVVQDPIKINVKNKKVSLSIIQFDLNMLYSMDAEVERDGEVVVSASILDGVVSSVIDSFIELTIVDESVLQIKTNSSISKINTLSNVVAEFSNIEDVAIKKTFSIDREIFIQGLRKTQHAAAISVIKPELNNIFIQTKEKNIYFVATDTFRLAEMRFLTETVNNSFSILIPLKSVGKILKVLEGSIYQTIEVCIVDEGIYLKTQDGTLFTRSTKGQFPDYKKIIPNNFNITFTVLKHDILNFLKKARYFSNTLNTIKMKLDKNNLILSFNNEMVGSTEDKIPITDLEGTGELPNFNYRFIHDAIQVVGDDKIKLCFVSGDAKPVLLQGFSNTLFTALISPLLNKQN